MITTLNRKWPHHTHTHIHTAEMRPTHHQTTVSTLFTQKPQQGCHFQANFHRDNTLNGPASPSHLKSRQTKLHVAFNKQSKDRHTHKAETLHCQHLQDTFRPRALLCLPSGFLHDGSHMFVIAERKKKGRRREYIG